MGKLHQVIAVESTVKANAETAFTKAYHEIQKNDQFLGLTKTYQPANEDGFQLPPESKRVLSNANTLITDVQAALEKLFDHVATKDTANQGAKADIEFLGVTVKDVPVATLLWVEKKLVDIRTFVSKIPTLDLAEEWTWDQSAQIFRAAPYATARQRKDTEYITVVQPTDKHPAQVVAKPVDVFEGTWTTTKLSGAMSPARKRDILGRVDGLLMAVKRARETANSFEVTNVSIGNTLLNLVFGS